MCVLDKSHSASESLENIHKQNFWCDVRFLLLPVAIFDPC